MTAATPAASPTPIPAMDFSLAAFFLAVAIALAVELVVELVVEEDGLEVVVVVARLEEVLAEVDVDAAEVTEAAMLVLTMAAP